jgi:hypothetical protein
MHNHVVKHIRDEQKKLKSFEEAGKDGWARYKQIYNGVNIKEKPCPSYKNHVLGGPCYICMLYTYTTNINLGSVQ